MVGLFFLVAGMFVVLFQVVKIEKERHERVESERQSQIEALNEELAAQKNQGPSHSALVAKGTFRPVPLLNKSELSIYAQLDAVLRDSANGYRVFPQVGLGGIVRSEKDIYKCYSDMRPDFTIVDRNGFPVLVIEYNGSGHYDRTSITRDGIKRTALEKAGIPLEIVTKPMDRGAIIALLSRHLAPRVAA